jgi:hypothetical protein
MVLWPPMCRSRRDFAIGWPPVMANAARTASPEMDRAPTCSASRAAGGPLDRNRSRSRSGGSTSGSRSSGRSGGSNGRYGLGRCSSRREHRCGYRYEQRGRRNRVARRGRSVATHGYYRRWSRSGSCGAPGVLGALRVRAQLEARDDADESHDRDHSGHVASPSSGMDGASHPGGWIPHHGNHRSRGSGPGTGSSKGKKTGSTTSSVPRTHVVPRAGSELSVPVSRPRVPVHSARGVLRGMKRAHRSSSRWVSPLGLPWVLGWG